MPSFDPARLDLANYAHQIFVETRFQDLDPLGHINNVALAGIFENGRVRFNHEMTHSTARPSAGERWLVARVEVNYLAEAHFPAPILIGNAIGQIGNRSWQILSVAFQNDRPVGLCDSTLVYQSSQGKSAISDILRAKLETLRLRTLR
ncbi:acyl-CoA thioesterase [Sphingopyxis yananensis]|uniref:acyl-CoA thioesterase n=1 Tax=Sphingopyxis yananensis TaxID=2886687 RepID=UPI001D120F2D|nr:acyl-CoA thioesterase [Sphingopyxis yananensis]MCC2602983.1 acyl-CoA thioesterase [Sphingopyxis yananensis]